MNPGEDDTEVWIPPVSDCMDYGHDPCPHCGARGFHHRTGRCGTCGRRPGAARAQRGLGDPTTVEAAGTRGMRMLWPVGAPDPEGWQEHTQLYATYVGRPSYTYLVLLQRTEIRHQPGIQAERLIVLPSTQEQVLINKVTGVRRFRESALGELLRAGLAEVRKAYERGDKTVLALFHEGGRDV